MSYLQYKNLPKGKYKVYISSDHKKGYLDLSHAKINGYSKKEIFLVVIYVIHQWQIMN